MEEGLLGMRKAPRFKPQYWKNKEKMVKELKKNCGAKLLIKKSKMKQKNILNTSKENDQQIISTL